MRYSVACFSIVLLLAATWAKGQSTAPPVKSHTSHTSIQARRNSARSRVAPKDAAGGSIKICEGVVIPTGYVITAREASSVCPHGAYILKKDPPRASSDRANGTSTRSMATQSRPRTVMNAPAVSDGRELVDQANNSIDIEPRLSVGPLATTANLSSEDSAPTNLEKAVPEEVGAGDIVRIDTNLVTVPVSVLDRQGRLIPNLARGEFRVFENNVEQQIAYFEPTEEPFTVALLLDTSGSTVFHLSDIKEAAIAFTKQLRPQDRVLIVTFNDQVLLLTEATSDLQVITDVVARNANTGFATRLYDALYLVIKQRLNKIKGRKAIVLFTDGVDTASYLASYKSTLHEVEELDALIYPVQYDTTDFIAATQPYMPSTTSNTSRWPPDNRQARTYGPSVTMPESNRAEYELANHYLHQLAANTGARLYDAGDRLQLAAAFSKVAGELRCQYSLGYYPHSAAPDGERRQIKVRVDQPDLVVRARESYVQHGSSMSPK